MDGQMKLSGVRGWLRWQEEAGGVVFRAEAEDPGDGLYKVYITYQNGTHLIGTLIPENGRLILRRTLSRGELERVGCRKIEGAEARLEFSFETEKRKSEWEPAELEGFSKDPVLSPLFKKLTGALMCREETEIRLAIPFFQDRPFQLVPLICLGACMELEGKQYLCFSFDKEGRPKCKKISLAGA